MVQLRQEQLMLQCLLVASLGQEFIIKSQGLEDKINQLLPSQGGFQAGVDLSASTQIVPIVDLTETAEGSNLRQDLQTSLSLTSISDFFVADATTDIINTTGYYRVFGSAGTSSNAFMCFQLTDGATTKIFAQYSYSSGSGVQITPFDFIVFLGPGDILQARSDSVVQTFRGATRQIATISGELVNPL